MVELRDEDRRALTAGVLRINKASSAVASSSQSGQWEVIAPDLGGVTWKEQRAWDGNSALGSMRFVLQRTMFAASEQARGLAELARSSFGYTVALATLARGSVEALSRANWVLSSGSADEMLIRHASLEYADLRYPLQHGLAVRHQGKEGDVWVAVDAYRQRIEAFLAGYGLSIVKAGLTELATNLMGEIYNEAPQLYSGMSAAAHGQGWATGNFFDNEKQALRRDDQMVIEYCAYAIEATTHVTDKFLTAFQPDRASAERWISERDQVDQMLRVILQRRDHPFAVG